MRVTKVSVHQSLYLSLCQMRFQKMLQTGNTALDTFFNNNRLLLTLFFGYHYQRFLHDFTWIGVSRTAKALSIWKVCKKLCDLDFLVRDHHSWSWLNNITLRMQETIHHFNRPRLRVVMKPLFKSKRNKNINMVEWYIHVFLKKCKRTECYEMKVTVVKMGNTEEII